MTPPTAPISPITGVIRAGPTGTLTLYNPQSAVFDDELIDEGDFDSAVVKSRFGGDRRVVKVRGPATEFPANSFVRERIERNRDAHLRRNLFGIRGECTDLKTLEVNFPPSKIVIQRKHNRGQEIF